MNYEEITEIVEQVFSRAEKAKNLILHKVVRQSPNCLVVRVSYTWYLNGWAKQVKDIEHMLYKDKEVWKMLV